MGAGATLIGAATLVLPYFKREMHLRYDHCFKGEEKKGRCMVKARIEGGPMYQLWKTKSPSKVLADNFDMAVNIFSGVDSGPVVRAAEKHLVKKLK